MRNKTRLFYKPSALTGLKNRISIILGSAFMIITHQGGNYFKIQSGDLAILVDPETNVHIEERRLL